MSSLARSGSIVKPIPSTYDPMNEKFRISDETLEDSQKYVRPGPETV